MSKSPRIGPRPPEGWGNRSALGGTFLAMQDVRGNRDGLWSNEDQMAGKTGGLFDRQPLAVRAKVGVGVGLDAGDEIRALEGFRAELEAKWGQPTVASGVMARLRSPDLYAAQKAVALARFDRTPDEVSEHVVRAAGSVAGQAIEPRDVFTQLWAAKGVPTGRVVVLSPGFQETWRDYSEVIDQLNAKGHEVLVMDHQWASETDQNPGGLDRGSGVARDVAAVMAKAAELAKDRHGDDGTVVLAGVSMGGGPGAAGAAVFAAADEIALEGGVKVPKRVPTALFDPFFAATPSSGNRLLALASKIPLANTLRVPSTGLPNLTDDRVAEQKGAQNAVLADARAQLASMTRALPDLALIRQLAQTHRFDLGPTLVVHAERDSLADFGAAKEFAETVGAELRSFDSSNHVHQLSPSDQHRIVDAIDGLTVAKHGTINDPHQYLRLRQLPFEVSADLKRGTVRYEIPLDELNTAPLGDRAFVAAIARVELPEMFLGADGEGLKHRVTHQGGKSSLVLEGTVLPQAFQMMAAPISIILESGQRVVVEVEPDKLALNLTATRVSEDEESLANRQSYRASQAQSLSELEAMAANPDLVRAGARVAGRPALEYYTDALKNAEAARTQADLRLAAVTEAVKKTWAGLTPIQRSFAVQVADARVEDPELAEIQARASKAHHEVVNLGRRQAQLSKVVDRLSKTPGVSMGDYRSQLAETTRALGAAERELEQRVSDAVERLGVLGETASWLDIVEALHPLEGEPKRSLKAARGELLGAESEVALYARQLQQTRAKIAEQRSKIPASIERLRGEIAETDREIAELKARIEHPEPAWTIRDFRGS